MDEVRMKLNQRSTMSKWLSCSIILGYDMVIFHHTVGVHTAKLLLTSLNRLYNLRLSSLLWSCSCFRSSSFFWSSTYHISFIIMLYAVCCISNIIYCISYITCIYFGWYISISFNTYHVSNNMYHISPIIYHINKVYWVVSVTRCFIDKTCPLFRQMTTDQNIQGNNLD